MYFPGKMTSVLTSSPYFQTRPAATSVASRRPRRARRSCRPGRSRRPRRASPGRSRPRACPSCRGSSGCRSRCTPRRAQGRRGDCPCTARSPASRRPRRRPSVPTPGRCARRPPARGSTPARSAAVCRRRPCLPRRTRWTACRSSNLPLVQVPMKAWSTRTSPSSSTGHHVVHPVRARHHRPQLRRVDRHAHRVRRAGIGIQRRPRQILRVPAARRRQEVEDRPIRRQVRTLDAHLRHHVGKAHSRLDGSTWRVRRRRTPRCGRVRRLLPAATAGAGRCPCR